MKQPLVLALFLLLLIGSVFGATIQLDKTTVQKGETVFINGTCVTAFELEIRQNNRHIQTEPVPCSAGGFQIEKKIPLWFPSGETQVVALESGRENTQTIQINPSRESGFLSLTTLSPTTTAIERQNTISFKVQIQDGVSLLTNAMVQIWDLNGKQVPLVHTQEGIYEAAFAIPYNAALETHSFVITAVTADENAGGERTLVMEVTPANIQIQLTQPNLNSIPSATEVEFVANATYADGSALHNPKLEVVLAETLPMAQTNPTTFSTKTVFTSNAVGSGTFFIFAQDDANNTKTQTFEYSVTPTLQLQLIRYAPYILGLGLFLVLVWIFIIPKIRGKKSKASLEQRKNQIEKELTELQTQYFEQNAISKEQFTKRSAVLEKELAETGKKLKT